MENYYRKTKAYELFLDELKAIDGKLRLVIGDFENSQKIFKDFKDSAHKLKGCADLFNYPKLGEKASKIDKNNKELMLSEVMELHSEVIEILSKL